MSDEYLEMCADFSNLIANDESISGNSLFEILKKYSSNISVFDMMAFSSQVIEENKYVQENYREDSQKSYIESFLYRVKDIPQDTSDYSKNIDRQSLDNAITTLKVNHAGETSKSKNLLIFYIASLYATFLLEEPIHPVGTPFPGSLKVEQKNGTFYCPVRDANIDTPNAVCNICLAEQLEF
ncbi:DUF2115 family protein [uncultured Methanobrevibacter sp.]|uniref:DUF2115 family protein n=1 Tax=uncultured Methanobrevibacter sp. TaxID=253161 RepID=UPI0025FCB977|nr:DUF2115 family protein [uncultured Methanobrevibacter sp.]